MEEQMYFFKVLTSKISNQHRLVDVLEEQLNVNTNSAYRRIRGETELSFSELLCLCRKFNLSLDEIFNFKSNQGVLFRYAPVNFADQGSYIAYLNRLMGTFASYKSAEKTEMQYTAQDIPFFYFLDFPDLMFLKLYAWNDTVTQATIPYDEFCNKLDKKTIIPIYRQMSKLWKQIPSKDIWTNQTVDTILRLIEYYYETGAFENKETIIVLLNQLNELIGNVNRFATDGYKEEDRKAPYSLYLCNVDFENNFMLIKREETMSCTVRLFTVNSIVTEHEALCAETAKWIQNLISKSVLVSGASTKERIRFFKASRNKVEGLINKIENN